MRRNISFLLLSLFCSLLPTLVFAKTNVAVVGSSTFYDGCVGNSKDGVTNGFVMQLKKALPDYNFTCFAKGGTESKYFLSQFKTGVANNGFKEIILYAGLNGLSETTAVNQKNLTEIITEAKKEGMKVIGVGAQPFKGWGAWTPLWDENIQKNNAWFKSKVDVYIDYSALLDKNGDRTIDAGLSDNPLHTNDAGQALLFQAVMSAAYGKSVPLPAPAPKTNPAPIADSQALKYGIGKQCSNVDCPNNLDCEDSDLSGANAYICVCKENIHCENAYGKSTADEKWECKNDGGIDAAHELHYCVGSVQGTKYPISPASDKTAPATDATASSDIAHAIKNTPLSEDELKALLQKPQPKIKIPGLNFSDITIEGELTDDDLGNTYLNIPFFGEYMAAVYKYLVVIAGIFCLVRIIVGGFLFTIPDTSGNSKSTGKNMIVQAVTGLLLSVSSYVILYTINPNLVQFKNLKVLYARQADFTQYIGKMDSTGGMGIDPNFHHSSVDKKNVKLTDQNIKDAAAKMGIDECLIWSFAKKESGGNLLAIGGDENYASTNKPVGARKDFLMSGKKYSCTIESEKSECLFTPMSENNYKISDGKYLNNYKVNGKLILNDDKHFHGKENDNDFSNPPDYDIDWRFSHGISFIQITIFPKNNGLMGQKINGPNGPEWARSIYGRWYTITDLLNPDTSLEAAMRFLTHGDDSNTCGNKPTVTEVFKCLRVSDPAMARALMFYKKCPLTKKMQLTPEENTKADVEGPKSG